MGIQKHLPVKSPHLKNETTVITGRVPLHLVNEVREILEEEHLSWADFLTACLCGFLDERGVKIKV